MRAHRRRHIAHGRHILGDILGDDDDDEALDEVESDEGDEGEVNDTDTVRPRRAYPSVLGLAVRVTCLRLPIIRSFLRSFVRSSPGAAG